MNITLTRTDAQLIDFFPKMKDRRDVADLLEVDDSVLIYHLYRHWPTYSEFELSKKSGEKRTIRVPVSNLKILQQKLLRVLTLIYEPRSSVNGFAKGRSILTNARFHTKKKLILNIDLKDFFPSINFGRVRGMFMANPYKLPPEVATVLAQICCYENELPQGAPTSPIISNMLCSKLDGEIQQIAKRYRCTYTRYADDITLSTSRTTLPDDLVIADEIDGRTYFKIGSLLNDVIVKNGFVVNPLKVKLFNPMVRQDVTGLIVNKKPNVRRGYIKNVRAILHAWEKYGLKNATADFAKKNIRQRRIPEIIDLRFIVQGKINFIKMIRGERDAVYRKLQNRFNKLTQKQPRYLPPTVEQQIFSRLWVIQSGSSTGTAFMLDGYGLVTCAHVIEVETDVKVWQFNDPLMKRNAQVTGIDRVTDLATLEITSVQGGVKPDSFKCGDSAALIIGSALTAYGFPNYQIHDEPVNLETKVRGFRRSDEKGIKRIVIDKPVFSGESGSPLLNSRDEVVAVVATGLAAAPQMNETPELSAIPIAALATLTIKTSTHGAISKIAE